ncbi:hypothetical protein TVAG_343450 [Trichomonas vaginalis G3]|uniref:Uncharacterized protein n=1 Tax=Trichomonas vaginalis (strain ATCC PRA-98 / G3) TaxID=412133 RepID=A2E1E9_TRIV3|nr:hypothetical protein TVAGG3_0320010 [Trichomonas vaginalis G3]EAY13516.1 hypothetical protein TVAG_343450 [Trichomonas vaginalis G3]KAI5529219.1 hypothetical protein TVAGG3_0320010 [Trichomonas vaginalis G3]|eukprot:XP_001325739.1 hypothetical protein [Trichomonas vaginalis G3]
MHDEANVSLIDNKQEIISTPAKNIDEFKDMETIPLVGNPSPAKEPVPAFPPMIQ